MRRVTQEDCNDVHAGVVERIGQPHQVMARIAAAECVVLDGSTATEIPRGEARSELEKETWGLRSLLEGPAAVREVHQRYVAVGCDVIATNTWGCPRCCTTGGHQRGRRPSRSAGWTLLDWGCGWRGRR